MRPNLNLTKICCADPPFVGSPAADEQQLARVRRHFSDDDDSSREDNNGAEEMVFPLTYGRQGDQGILTRHKFDMREPEYVEDFEDYPTTQEDMDIMSAAAPEEKPFEEQMPDSDRLIFDRRERLDVKKPGPYWPFSDRSYYLNKVCKPY